MLYARRYPAWFGIALGRLFRLKVGRGDPHPDNANSEPPSTTALNLLTAFIPYLQLWDDLPTPINYLNVELAMALTICF